MWNRFSNATRNAADRAAEPRRADLLAVAQAPWHGQPDSAACVAVVVNLFNALRARLTVNGRVHPETCLAAIGAIAGFSAQRVLFEECRNVAALKLRTAKTRTGSEYYFGEPLNRMLVPAAEAENNRRLWPLAAAGAINAGLSRSDLPDLGEMFAHVATTLVGKAEGWPSVEAAHQPHMNGRETLRIVWPVAMGCFNGGGPSQIPRGQAVATRHWPAIAGRVAGALIERAAPVVHPRTALILVTESAIYASRPDKAGACPRLIAPIPPRLSRLARARSRRAENLGCSRPS
jgi:hypothetical protein